MHACDHIYNGAVTSAVLAVTTVSKMIVMTQTVSSIAYQSASLCSCPANGKIISKYYVYIIVNNLTSHIHVGSTLQQSIQLWVLIVMLIPWILLTLIIISVLICYFKFARKGKILTRNYNFINIAIFCVLLLQPNQNCKFFLLTNLLY